MMDFSLACQLVMSGTLFRFLKDLRFARILRQAQYSDGKGPVANESSLHGAVVDSVAANAENTCA